MVDIYFMSSKIIENSFWNESVQTWYQKLNSSENGLSQNQAELILKSQQQKLKIRSPLVKDFLLFMSQFKSPLMLLLIGAVIISGFLGDVSDVFIILFIVLSTGLLSFFQERNAGRVVEKLQSLIRLKSTVVREGKEFEIATDQIVPGDILLFNAGDLLPADCLIVESNELHANESSLTGESFPVQKKSGIIDEDTPLSKRYNCLWQGTSIVSGHSKALVIQTGSHTIFGNLTQRAAVNTETAFEKGIKDYGIFLMKITIFIAISILIINLLNHKGVIDSALFALALAVGMAPELLPAITTIAMSAGAKRMLAKKVIVKKLNSIQNFGEVDLLCTDKTGTITEGVTKISAFIDGNGNTSEWVKQLSFWNAYFESGYLNPIDEVLKQLPIQVELNTRKLGEIPYDFVRKRLSVAIQNKEKKYLITKGAFTQIISICSQIQMEENHAVDIQNHLEQIQKKYEDYGIQGLRAIAVCYKNIVEETITVFSEKEMIFVGFILIQDPVKNGIVQTIDELKQLQIGLKIITGDNKNVAQSIAKQIGIENPIILTGKEIFNTSSEALAQLVKNVHIFAEVEPQQKERILLSLKKNYTVAYMGDGINDVSAINAADVGISVNNAVDVAREAADFVLMEQDLGVLIDGIKEGRKTFSNTLKYIYINTGATFGNMFSMSFASLVLPFLPMLPKQILLTNFISDFPFLSVSSDNVDEEQMKHPGKWDLKLIRNYMLIFGIHSSIFDIITFLILLFYLKVKEVDFQTGWFVESVLTELFILFIIRTHKKFFESKPGKYLFILGILGAFITILLPYSPLAREFGMQPMPLSTLGIMLVIVIAYVITADMLKVWFFKKYDKIK